MAKHKGQKNEKKLGKGRANASKVQKPQQKPKAKPPKGAKRQNQHRQQHHIPIAFQRHDRILLLGEGDFTFARSLVEHYECRHVTATCFDSAEELKQKYPQTEEIIAGLKSRDLKVLCGVDATKLSPKEIRNPPLPSALPDAEADGDSSDEGDEADEYDEDDRSFSGFSDVDAQEQPKSPGRTTQSGPRGWDVIAFNFPHVGGKSTDVNRQVRHNQSLLVSFFKAALPLLTPPCPSHPAGGVILVTLFEGEPYTLWNVKDLGRHAGLRSERSWKFDWSAYPGYRHARTLGNIEGGGGWKGEERAARTYAFVNKDAPTGISLFSLHNTVKKNKKDGSEDEDD